MAWFQDSLSKRSKIATGGVAVTISDVTNLDSVVGLFIGGAGNVAVEGKDGVDVTFTGCVAGQILPIRVNKVLETGTTATNITAFTHTASGS